MSHESLYSQKPLLKRLALRLIKQAKELNEENEAQNKKPLPSKTIENKVIEQEHQKKIPQTYQSPSLNEKKTLNSNKEPKEKVTVFNLSHDKNRLVFLINEKYQTVIELNHYNRLFFQLTSLGIECKKVLDLNMAREEQQKKKNSIIIAPLASSEDIRVLPDETIEKDYYPLIFTASEDNQSNRLKAIRNKGMAFSIEPLTLSSLFSQIEKLFDFDNESPGRVLVMEDSKAQAKFYEKALQKGNFKIRVIYDPTLILEGIRGFDPEIIFMDMQMPESSGIELTQMIRQIPRYTHIPIIFLSAEESFRKQNQALLAGGDAFILKPIKKEQLIFMATLYTKQYRSLTPKIDINPETDLPYTEKFKYLMRIEAARFGRSAHSLVFFLIQINQIELYIKNKEFSFINNAVNQLSRLLKKRFRQTDIIGHIDVDCLGVLMSCENKNDYTLLIDTIQEQFSQLTFFLNNKTQSLTLCFSLSEMKKDLSISQWLQHAKSLLDDKKRFEPHH
jgi:PleD family two-component response regulator